VLVHHGLRLAEVHPGETVDLLVGVGFLGDAGLQHEGLDGALARVEIVGGKDGLAGGLARGLAAAFLLRLGLALALRLALGFGLRLGLGLLGLIVGVAAVVVGLETGFGLGEHGGEALLVGVV